VVKSWIMMNGMMNCQTAKLVTKSMTEATIQSRINDMASGKVTRTSFWRNDCYE